MQTTDIVRDISPSIQAAVGLSQPLRARSNRSRAAASLGTARLGNHGKQHRGIAP
jgi:hypothetical protein